MPFHCKNWTFRIVEYNGTYYMYDTYWSSDDHPIELTDQNIDEFEYLFKRDEVRFVNDYEKWLEYEEEDRWFCGINSAGSRYIVRCGASKNKKRVMERLEHEIESLKSEISSKERILEGIRSGELNFNYY